MTWLDTHRPSWPRFRPAKPRERLLAILQDGQLTTDHGEIYDAPDYAAVKALALGLHADILVDDVRRLDWLEDACLDTKEANVNAASNSLDQQPRAVSITWRVGNRWAAVHSASKWGRRCDLSLLSDLRALSDHLEQGTYASPGSLGSATMKAKTTGRYKCPCLDLEKDIRDTLIGGRAEMFVEPKTLLDDAYETDRTSAYVAEAKRPLPVGTEIQILKGASLELLSRYPVWYHQMTIFRPAPVRYSTFGVPSLHGHVQWPIAHGWFENVWLWSWQLADVLAEGAIVIPGPKGGWAWSKSEPVLAEWADWMFAKRQSAPTKAVADLVKLVMVAAIGSHLQSRRRWSINAAGEGEPIHDARTGLLTSYSATSRYDRHADLMPHWSSTILHAQQLALYRRQQLETLSGNQVLMTNFDSLLLAHPSTLPLSVGELGGWRQVAMGSVYVVAERSLVSADKIRLPGQHGRGREQTAIEFAERLSAHKQWVGKEFALSPTARYLRRTRGQAVAEEYLRNELGKGDP